MRKSVTRILVLVVSLVVLMAAACTEINPSWVGNNAGGDAKVYYDTGTGDLLWPPPDLGPGKDGTPVDGPKIPRDLPPPPPDLTPWPDTKPWVCTKDADCDDKLPCTADKCVAAKCQNSILPGNCKIGGACFKKDDANPKNSCQVCDPGIFALQWSPLAEGVPCQQDGLSCTSDICSKGQCTHPVLSGCVIGGKCVADGAASPQSTCSACIPPVSKTAYTAADGLPCAPGAGKPGLCMANKCRGFSEGTWGVPNAALTSLHSVDGIPLSTGVWAAGRYRDTPQGAEKGVLMEVSALAAGKPPATKLTASPLADLHGDLAVGHKGQALRYLNGAWAPDKAIETALGGVDRWAVWSSGAISYLAGPPGQNKPAMVVCGPSSGGVVACQNHSGVSQGRVLGRIFGTLAPTGQGPLWAVVMGDSAPEDIYFNSGNQTSWSTNGPVGCQDSGNNPCANTSWNTNDLDGGGPDDVWVVGSSSGLLRYDGKAWSKVTNVFPQASQLDLLAVYSSKKDNLVTVAGLRNNNGSNGRQVQLYNYNRKLDAWFGPVVLYTGPHNAPAAILDIGGKDYNDLWFVGQKEVGSGSSQSVRGWALKLQ